MQTKERRVQEQQDEALVNRLMPPPPPASESEPLMPSLLPQADVPEDDPEKIFLNAIAEIDTQSLPPQSPQPQEICWPLVILVFVCLFSCVAGTVMALLTYPTVTVAVVPVTRSVTLTMPLALLARS